MAFGNRNTPVLIAVGQHTNLGETLDDIHNPMDLAAIAVKRCLDQLPVSARMPDIDTISVCRLFSDSAPIWKSAFGGSDNVPRSIAARTGLNPATAIYAESGGQSPQRLLNEQCERIYRGDSRAGLVVGVEAIRSSRRGSKLELSLDWSESPGGSLDDRADGLGMATGYEYAHGIGIPIQTYSLFEHAIRHEQGHTVAQHQKQMAELFAPISCVAASNPYAQFPTAHSVADLQNESSANYRLTDMYTRNLVAQDAVDQSGAVLVVAEDLADELGVSENDRVYLHGYSFVTDTPVIYRPTLHHSRAIARAGQEALDQAGCAVGDIKYFDIYSCFPSAVSCAQAALGLGAIDPGRLTLTGGLPYFGGAGNSYSIHGIVEMVKTLRKAPGEYGLVLANGGYLSKIAVGIFSSSRPTTWHPNEAGESQVDGWERQTVVEELNGSGVIETYAAVYSRGEIKFTFVVGQTEQGARFMATARKGDAATAAMLVQSDSLGRRIDVCNEGGKNYFRFALAS